MIFARTRTIAESVSAASASGALPLSCAGAAAGAAMSSRASSRWSARGIDAYCVLARCGFPVALDARNAGEELGLSAISLRGVSKAWGATRAVDEVSFEAPAGRFVVLLGPSGCGKSTTLRLIAGLEDVSGGRIFIGDVEVTTLPPARRGISMVFQSYALFPHLSVAENILFGLKGRGVQAGARAQRLARVAGLLGMEQLLERKPSQLSGGQQQRVALGRAIIAEAPVCLMD